MSRLLRKSVLFGLCLLVPAGFASAQTNWLNANDGICDPLQSATPGLFGLCLAFCEANTCVPDFSAADPFADCTPSSSQLFNLYGNLQQPGDPDLPCVNLVGGCPCFSQQQVDDLPTPYQQCAIDFTLGNGLATNLLQVQGLGGQSVLEGANSTCIWVDSFVDPPVFLFLEISLAQAEACRDILLNTITANSDQCDAIFCGDDLCTAPDTCGSVICN